MVYNIYNNLIKIMKNLNKIQSLTLFVSIALLVLLIFNAMYLFLDLPSAVYQIHNKVMFVSLVLVVLLPLLSIVYIYAVKKNGLRAHNVRAFKEGDEFIVRYVSAQILVYRLISPQGNVLETDYTASMTNGGFVPCAIEDNSLLEVGSRYGIFLDRDNFLSIRYGIAH